MSIAVSPNANEASVVQYGQLSNLDSTDTAAGTSYLTPDALMMYCESRLNSIDSQIQTGIQQQQNSNNEQQLISDVSASLQAFAVNGTTNGDPNKNVPNETQCAQIETQLESTIATIQHTDSSSPALAPLMTLHDTIMASGTGPNAPGVGQGYYGPAPSNAKPDSQLTSTEISSYLKELDSATSTVNSSAEMQMIQLQSLMSQRQTAVQLSTNLVQSLGDQLSKITDNIGH